MSTTLKGRAKSRDIARAERDANIVRLRKAGYSYDEIGAQVGLTKGAISKILHRYMDGHYSRTAEDIDSLVATEQARLDQLWRGIYPAAMSGNLGAVDRCIKIMERRARLLGLDAPNKVAPTDPSGANEYTGGGLSSLLAAIQPADNAPGST